MYHLIYIYVLSTLAHLSIHCSFVYISLSIHHSPQTKWDAEIDTQIEISSAKETSPIVLETRELMPEILKPLKCPQSLKDLHINHVFRVLKSWSVYLLLKCAILHTFPELILLNQRSNVPSYMSDFGNISTWYSM